MERRMIYSALVMFFFCILLLVPPVSPSKATPSLPPSQAQIENILQDQSSFFTENKGQWDPEILFMGDTSFGKVAFTREAVYYQLIKVIETKKSMEKEPQGKEEATRLTSFPDRNLPHGIREEKERIYESQVVKLSFIEGNIQANIRGENLLSHYHNYFIGNDPKKWASYCKNYAKVYYEDIWEGIDLAYFFTEEGMKYEYYVEPKADIQKLQVRVEGAEVIQKKNKLEFKTLLGSIFDDQLRVYGKTTLQSIQAKIKICNDQYSFLFSKSERKEVVVIDPLIWSTYLGGSETDIITDLSLDSEMNTIIVGSTNSISFPISENPLQKVNFGSNFFITKLNTAGSHLIFSTFIGGNSNGGGQFFGNGCCVALDKTDNIVLAGDTYSADFPITSGVIQKENKGKNDCIVVKISTNGSDLLFSTFLGGTSWDVLVDVSLNEQNNVFICGKTFSQDFPVSSWGVLQNLLKGETDCFIVNMNPFGSKLLYSTFVGGSGYEDIQSLFVDLNGNAYFTGTTGSRDFPIFHDFRSDYSPPDCFIAKLNPLGTKLLVSSSLGFASSIMTDIDENIYICGTTSDSNFPTTEEAYQTKIKGESDFYIAKLNKAGSILLFSTFLGGSKSEKSESIHGSRFCIFEVDTQGKIIITGCTLSDDFPITTQAFQKKYKGQSDIIVAKLNSSGSNLIFSSYFGGSRNDIVTSISMDSNNYVNIGGYTESQDLPITPEAFQTVFNRSYIQENVDGFVAKIKITNPDETPPILEIYQPRDDYETSDNEILITGRAYDEESEILKVTVNNKELLFIGPDGSFELYHSLNTGLNKVEFLTTNSANLSSRLILTITQNESDDQPDKDPPDLTIRYPFPDQTITKNTILVQGIAFDYGSGLYKVLVNQQEATLSKNGQFERELVLEHGKNTITVIAKDQAENQTKHSLDVFYNEIQKEILVIELWIGSLRAYLNQQPMTLDSPPIIYHGRTMVPLRFISECFMAYIFYDPLEQEVNIAYGSIYISLWINKTKARIEKADDEGKRTNEIIVLDAPPMIRNNRTLVPLRFIAEAFGASIDWDGKEEKIILKMEK